MRCVALALLALSACSSFDPLPEPEAGHEDAFPPGGPDLPPVETLEYGARLGIFSAGRAALNCSREGDFYRMRAEIGTTGLVSLLYGVDILADAVIDAPGKRALRYSWTTGEDDDAKRVEITFGPEVGRMRSLVTTAAGVTETVRDDPRARDPLSMVYALRRIDLVPGRTYSAAMFPEHNLYDAQVLVVGPERVDVPAGEFETILVRADLRKIVDGAPEEKVQSLAVWLTPDDRRTPVQFALDTRYGRVTLRLANR